MCPVGFKYESFCKKDIKMHTDEQTNEYRKKHRTDCNETCSPHSLLLISRRSLRNGFEQINWVRYLGPLSTYFISIAIIYKTKTISVIYSPWLTFSTTRDLFLVQCLSCRDGGGCGGGWWQSLRGRVWHAKRARRVPLNYMNLI